MNVIPESDVTDNIGTNLHNAIQAYLDDRAARDNEVIYGTLVRFVIITEEVTTGETRRSGWMARSIGGVDLYPWETIGLIRYALLNMEAE